MREEKLATDEARRVAQHDAVKGNIEREVNHEIAARADRTIPSEAARMENVAGEMRHRAIDEVVTTEREVEVGRGIARVSQVVDYLFGVLYALLGIRLVLALMAARSEAGFVQFITAVTDPFYAPFRDIVASPVLDGGHTVLLPLVVAIAVYMLVHAGIKGILRISVHRRTEI
jgi:uncharacterized protein YggT (Ycf19 family)